MLISEKASKKVFNVYVSIYRELTLLTHSVYTYQFVFLYSY